MSSSKWWWLGLFGKAIEQIIDIFGKNKNKNE